VKVIGWVDPAMMWSAVDIVLSTSQNEGMPIALIEAQLAGLPVVTSEVGSVIEVIENNVTGFVTDKSALALEVALKQLLTNQNLIRKFGLAGAASAKVKFEISKMIQKHKTVYTNLI
jgi:glycosyltransferase involved in cell wall biosynthesis